VIRSGQASAVLTLLAGLCLPLALGPALAGSPEPSDRRAAVRESRSDLFLKRPYLIYPGDPSRIEVLWQLAATVPSTIAWGPDSTCASGSALSQEYGSDHQHAYTIGGLTPGSRVYFRVTAASSVFGGSCTAAPPAGATDLKFFAYGDTRTNGAVHDSVAAAIDAAMFADPAYQTLVVSVGDLVSDGRYESYWTSEFFNPSYTNVVSMLSRLPYQSAMGNHEEDGILFTKYFPYPFEGGRYWSFDYGPAHFAMVDQYSDYSTGSPQLDWLAADLAASAKRWKFVLLHEPGWTAGGHENNPSVEAYLQPLCVQYGVSIVFGGHNHYYSRAVVSGVQHVTTGGGGAPLYWPTPTYPYIVAAARAHHYCAIDISGATLVFRALAVDGTLLDTFTMGGLNAPVAPGAAESTGPAFPNPFSRETTIQWQAPSEAGSRLLILDVCGRLVRGFRSEGSGPQSARWDGRDEQGRPVGQGIYYYRLDRAALGAKTGRVLLLR
jgi:hypothetical protein